MCIAQQSWKYSLHLWSPPETLLKAEIKKAGQIRVSQPAAACAQAQCISAGRVLLLSDAGSPTNFFHVPCYFFLTLFLLFNSETWTISYADVEHPKEPLSLFGSSGSHACSCWMVEAVGGRVQEGLLKLVIRKPASMVPLAVAFSWAFKFSRTTACTRVSTTRAAGCHLLHCLCSKRVE